MAAKVRELPGGQAEQAVESHEQHKRVATAFTRLTRGALRPFVT